MPSTSAPSPAATATAAPPPSAPPKETRESPWRATSFGGYLLPDRAALGDDFDVVFHFHVGKSAEAEYRESGIPAVIVAAQHGLFATAYARAYEDRERFPRALDEVTDLLRKETGRTALRPRRVALVAWSAGYGAIKRVLADPEQASRVDTVVLLDGLHAAYRGRDRERSPEPRDLDPFVRFAGRAAKGDALMIVTHSAIVPPGYASTTETSEFLIRAVGAERRSLEPEPAPGGLTLRSRADRGDFHVLGYGGGSKSAHIAHLRLVLGLMRDHLAPRWKR